MIFNENGEANQSEENGNNEISAHEETRNDIEMNKQWRK